MNLWTKMTERIGIAKRFDVETALTELVMNTYHAPLMYSIRVLLMWKTFSTHKTILN